MRESASRGFFLGSTAPFGYKRIKVGDGVKERPTLEVDPTTTPVVREIFEKSLRGSGHDQTGNNDIPIIQHMDAPLCASNVSDAPTSCTSYTHAMGVTRQPLA